MSILGNLHANHRSRLRGRYARLGADGLEVHELLELFLFDAIPRVDTNPIAHRLLERFGSLWEVLNAPEHELSEVKGIGVRAAEYIAVANRKLCLGIEEELTRRPMATFEHVSNYLIWHCRHISASPDTASVIMTDPEMHFIGACDYMYLAPAEIAEDCREADAACAILGVGKTYGAASFSAVSEEFERCGVELCDVIIVSDFNTESIRDKS